MTKELVGWRIDYAVRKELLEVDVLLVPLRLVVDLAVGVLGQPMHLLIEVVSAAKHLEWHDVLFLFSGVVESVIDMVFIIGLWSRCDSQNFLSLISLDISIKLGQAKLFVVVY